jgi:hypothetical protein
MSEQTISLTDVVNKLGDLGKIGELYDIVKRLKNLSIEINSFVDKTAGSFVIANDFKLTEIKIMGYFSNCLYYVTDVDPQKVTLSDLFNKFFSDANTFYANALRCISDVINELANIIDNALPKDDP